METEVPGTAVDRWFFSPIYYPRSPLAVVRWWESRRLLFNVAVGGAGMLTLTVGAVLARFSPHPVAFFPPPVAIAVYALAANVCYSFGSVADLLLRRRLGDRAPAVGTALFRYGFAFGVGLTLLPIPIFVLSWIVRLFVS